MVAHDVSIYVSWCLMVAYDVSKCLMMSHCGSWCLKMSHGVSLWLMMSHDVSQCLIVSPWCLIVAHDVSWCLIDPQDTWMLWVVNNFVDPRENSTYLKRYVIFFSHMVLRPCPTFPVHCWSETTVTIYWVVLQLVEPLAKIFSEELWQHLHLYHYPKSVEPAW